MSYYCNHFQNIKNPPGLNAMEPITVCHFDFDGTYVLAAYTQFVNVFVWTISNGQLVCIYSYTC